MILTKKMTTKQLEANRRNARQSSGPKTINGKKRSSRNSTTHGILSSQVLVPAGLGEENVPAFAQLVEGLTQHWKPIGLMEDLLVQEIAVGYWRLSRLLRCESGEIGKSAYAALVDVSASRDAAMNDNDPANMMNTSVGLAKISTMVTSAIQELESSGKLDHTTIERLRPYLTLPESQCLAAFNNQVEVLRGKGESVKENH